MQKYHSFFHKIKSIVGYTVAVVVILIALSVSGLRFILTTANLYQQEAEDLASNLLEQPVNIGGMDAKLSGLEPTLIFHNVELISAKTKLPVFSLYRVDIGLSIRDLILKQQIVPNTITIRGVNLEVTRTVTGKIKIKGVDIDGLTASSSGQEQDATFKNWLLTRSNIGLEDFNILWKDEKNAGLSWMFDNVNLLMKNYEERHQLTITANLPEALGEKIKVAIDLNGDIAKPELWSSRFYIESKSLNLRPLQNYFKYNDFFIKDGVIDLSLWGDWEQSRLKHVSGKVDLNDFLYQFKNKKPVPLSIVSGRFDALHDDDNTWRVGVDKFFYIANEKVWPESGFSLAFKTSEDNFESLFVSADHIKIEDLTQLAIDNNFISNEFRDKVKSYEIKGDVRKFRLAWYDNRIQTIQSDFSNIGSATFHGIPAVSGLSGHIDFNENKGNIILNSQNTIFEFSDLFRNKFELNNLSANINFLSLDKGILFNIDNLRADNTEVNLESTVKLWVPTEKSASPYMDLQTYVSQADLSRLSHFLPAGIMNRELVKWLDNSIIAGRVHEGRFIFNGKLNEFPFKKHEGVFTAEFRVDDFELNYQHDWPPIKKASVEALFTGSGMLLNLYSGESINNTLSNSTAQIDSFSSPELKLTLSTKGTLQDTVHFLVNSPIMPRAKEKVKTMRMLGNASTKFSLNLPLNKKISAGKKMTYHGVTSVRNAALFMLDDKIDITDVNANILFDEKGLYSEKFQANILGEPAGLTLETLKNDSGLQVSFSGKMEPGKILERFNILGAEHVSGKTAWQGSMLFPGKKAAQSYPVFKIKSDLQGVNSTLPESFYKNSKSKQALDLSLNFTPDNSTLLDVEFGNKASALLEIHQSEKSVYLERGAISFSAKKAVLPQKKILYVDGTIKNMSPALWEKALKFDNAKNKDPFIIYPVVLNLEELNLILPDKKEAEDKLRSAMPDEFPVVSGIVKKFYFDDVFLGRFDLSASRMNKGIRFDEIILSAQHMKVVGKGDWTYEREAHTSRFDLTLSSDNFGDMLKSLGFSAIIENGTAQAIAKINWSAPLSQFSLNKLNGEIQLKLENGSIKEVDAGAGRMLGLFSLSALPRKLFGDFKDTFKSGFSFDKAQGDITIRNGDAYTDGFEINSAVAEITVTGRTGIAARDYENTITVVPDVGGTAAGVVALLGNIPAGIGIWLVNKLSGDKINESSLRKYEISGSWDKPVIERIDQPADQTGEQ